MKIWKKWWFWVIIVIILSLFFFPKSAGQTGGGVVLSDSSRIDQEWSCFGFKHTVSLGLDAGEEHLCFGIPHSARCFQVTFEGSTQIRC